MHGNEPSNKRNSNLPNNENNNSRRPKPATPTSDAATLAWTATVVRDWCYVFNLFDCHACSLQGGDCTFSTGARSLDPNFDFLNTAFCCLFGGLLSCNLASKWGALAGTFETTGSCTCPTKGITFGISNGHRGVVEGSLNMGDRYGDVSSGFSSLIDLGRHYSVSQILVETAVTFMAALAIATAELLANSRR